MVKLNRNHLITETCSSCGVDFERPAGRKQVLCPACRIGSLMSLNDEYHAKSGPRYENLIRKQAKAALAEAKRLKIKL